MSRTGRGRAQGAEPRTGVRGGRVRPSDLRAQADEMAALLDEAAPRARRRRRRRSTALPAAVAAFGALSVGGVGLALGLTPTGAEGQLPAAPSPVLADPGTAFPATTTDGVPATADLDPAVAGADLIRPDDRPSPGAGPAARPDPSSGPRNTAPTTRPATTAPTSKPARPPRSTRPRPTTTPRPTVTRSATPRSTTSRPGAPTASPRPGPGRSSALPSIAPDDAPDPSTDPSSSPTSEE